MSEDPYSKEAVKKILMRRDGMSEKEAQELIDNTQEMVTDAVYNGDGVEDVEDMFAGELGLEPDYLMSFLPL
jgi:hypothetical protein